MGICFSTKKKKKKQTLNDPNPKKELVVEVEEMKKPNPIQTQTQTQTQTQKVQEEEEEVELKKEVKPPNEAQPSVEKKPAVFLVFTQKPNDSDEKKKMKTEEKEKEPIAAEEAVPVTVRTSSCSKEEVDAILIQCGRLSRTCSSSKHSGSKRSYDFDNENSGIRDVEEEEHQLVSRPSPRRRTRRRTPNRERSGSRETSGGGGGGGSSRRVCSRSPGRRSEGVGGGSNVSDPNTKQQQPTKMVSVPAREKGVISTTGIEKKGGATTITTTTNNRRNASPRSRSPANNGKVLSENVGVQQSLSRSTSSSRKAENSPLPFKRNPMTEIDDNSLRGNNTTNKVQTQKTTDVAVKNNININNNNNNINSFVREQLKSCRPKEKEPEIVEEGKEMKGDMFNNRALTRTRTSRKSSRDFDHILGLNPDTNATAYTTTSLLLQDIHNYHQLSLPACVSKACSILEAVADLNSSSSDQSHNENGRFGRRGLNQKDSFVETEVKGKDTSEMEPQESAGSNSFVGQPRHSSWEMNSVDSTDRSQSNHGEEEPEDESSAIRDFEARGKSLRGGGGSSSNNSLPNNKRDFDHRQLVRGGRRAFSNPVAAPSS